MMLKPHTALFVALTGVEKTHLALHLFECVYLNHFKFFIILCPTLRYNKMYCLWRWFWTDSYIIPIEPGDSPGIHLYDWIGKLDNLLAGFKLCSQLRISLLMKLLISKGGLC